MATVEAPGWMVVTDTLDAYGGGGVPACGASTRESVNELECDGAWLRMRESVRVKNDAVGGASTGCDECADSRNCVIWV